MRDALAAWHVVYMYVFIVTCIHLFSKEQWILYVAPHTNHTSKLKKKGSQCHSRANVEANETTYQS